MIGEIEDREGKRREGGKTDGQNPPPATVALGWCTWSPTAEPRPHGQDARSPDVKAGGRQDRRPKSSFPFDLPTSTILKPNPKLQHFRYMVTHKKKAQNTNTEQ